MGKTAGLGKWLSFIIIARQHTVVLKLCVHGYSVTVQKFLPFVAMPIKTLLMFGWLGDCL